jgi:hypothetical protein
VGQANADRLKQPFDRHDMSVKLKEQIADGTTAGLACIRTWNDHVERTHDPPKGDAMLLLLLLLLLLLPPPSCVKDGLADRGYSQVRSSCCAATQPSGSN